MTERAPPELDAALVAAALGVALRGALADAGLERWVIGVSGGLDSALAAALAVEACGPESVRAFFMPGRVTTPESAAAAEEVADRLGIGLETVSIEPLLQAAPLPAGAERRRGNFATRSRTAVLYDRAAEADALVLGTSNKSELALGYTTRWGDMAADLWVLGDLYKTQVLDVARAMELPATVVEREPSAELWAGQTDEGEMGFSYGAADAILYYYLDERRRPDQIVALGHSRETVEAVLARVRSQAFKRRMPPVPKLSERTIGHDFLHPRVWRGPA
ncbi:MAG: NAD+ synthase [Gemmatimonadetes bacterium]|nr:NAD+ synthase [Gemmatimonadota bacterium]